MDENKSKEVARIRKWKNKNKEKAREQSRRYYQKHKERINQLAREKRQNNKEHILKKEREYYKKNSQKIIERNKKYRILNPQVFKKSYLKGISELNDKYVKTKLRVIGVYDPPNELIELKRTTIKLKRTLKTKNHENSK